MAQQQHKVIQMDIRPKLLRRYKEHKPPETGMHISYGPTKLREDPQKTERWLTQRQEPPEITQATTATADWEQIKKPTHGTLQTIHPKDGKKEKTKHLNGRKKQNNGSRKKNGGEMQQYIEE